MNTTTIAAIHPGTLPRAALGAVLGALLVPVLALTLLAAAPARAQLFKDDELYKRAAQLEAQRAADVKRADQIEARAATQEARSEQQGRVLIDLTQQIEALKNEIARLRGQIEVLTNDIENAQKRQRDFYTDLDARLRKVEPPPPPTPGAPLKPPTAEEQKAYEAGLNLVKTSNFKGAVDAFGGFLRTYPNSQLGPSAQYWIGNSQFALRDYKAAIAAQQRVVEVWPDDAKAPDALLNISSAHTELKDIKSARAAIEDLIKRYPQSDAARTGAERLKRLR